MSKPKYITCRHSTGDAREFIVYIKQSCPNYIRVNDIKCSSKMNCNDCEEWEGKDEETDTKR